MNEIENIKILETAVIRGKDNPLLPDYVKQALSVLPVVINDFEKRITALEKAEKNG